MKRVLAAIAAALRAAVVMVWVPIAAVGDGVRWVLRALRPMPSVEHVTENEPDPDGEAAADDPETAREVAETETIRWGLVARKDGRPHLPSWSISGAGVWIGSLTDAEIGTALALSVPQLRGHIFGYAPVAGLPTFVRPSYDDLDIAPATHPMPNPDPATGAYAKTALTGKSGGGKKPAITEEELRAEFAMYYAAVNGPR